MFSTARWVLFSLFVAIPASFAQTQTAQITGIVSDASGAVIPDARVLATNVDTGVGRSTISNSTGNFVFAGMPPGRYRIEVTKDGFRSAVVPSLNLDVNQNASVPIELG